MTVKPKKNRASIWSRNGGHMKGQAVKILAVLGLSIPLASLSLYAQTFRTVTANIPFNFVVGKTTLAPGEYAIKSLSPSAIQISRTDNRTATVVLVLPMQARKSPEVATLVFNQYGDQYFLSILWAPASKGGYELLRSSIERFLAKGKSEHRTVSIVARSEAVDVKLNFH
jgi:hypothetical protein